MIREKPVGGSWGGSRTNGRKINASIFHCRGKQARQVLQGLRTKDQQRLLSEPCQAIVNSGEVEISENCGGRGSASGQPMRRSNATVAPTAAMTVPTIHLISRVSSDESSDRNTCGVT